LPLDVSSIDYVVCSGYKWLLTPRGVAFLAVRPDRADSLTPHSAGWYAGEDLRNRYPKGLDPYVLGESANTITTYGYDPATGMQEPKVTLCQIVAA